MKRLKVSNTFLILVIIGILPVYPVFGSVLYNISGGVRNFPIDQATILSDDYDKTDSAFISADIPLDTSREWLARKEIIFYTIQEGDNLSQLARDFRLASATIRWVNNLSTTVLRIGQKLIIPPGDGYVYTVSAGDTIESISKKYSLTSEVILKNNPQSISGIKPGIMLYLPGLKPPVILPSGNDNVPDKKAAPYVLKLLAPKGRGFVPGHCTYFVAKYWNVNWRGNAKEWVKNAQKAGYKTGKVAQPGSIVVWYGPGYNLSYGHVAIVMSVDRDDGIMVVKDMNYTGLWRITTRTEKINNKYILGFIYDEKK